MHLSLQQLNEAGHLIINLGEKIEMWASKGNCLRPYNLVRQGQLLTLSLLFYLLWYTMLGMLSLKWKVLLDEYEQTGLVRWWIVPVTHRIMEKLGGRMKDKQTSRRDKHYKELP